MIDLASFGTPRDFGALLDYPRIAVFGASPAAAEVAALLADHGRKIEAYFDNGQAKHGTLFRGLTVEPGASAKAFAETGGAIVIAAAYQVEIATQLVSELGIGRDRVFPFVSRMFAGHFGRAAVEPHLRRIERVIERVADPMSQRYIEDLIRFRWTMSPLDLRRNPKLTGFYQYDAPGLGPEAGHHIVDCGAFTGDTAEVFLKRLEGNATLTAIEPLSRNFAALEQWLGRTGARDKVRSVKAAVGAAPGMASIDAGGDPHDPRAHIGASEGELIAVETLDRLFAGRYRDVHFVKIDIEGFELDALDGARALIGEAAPRLAIAGYHTPSHLWEIPERLDAIRPGYRIYVGHHPSAPYECEFFCAARDAAAAAA
jgi:FkbM family methyltransferase